MATSNATYPILFLFPNHFFICNNLTHAIAASPLGSPRLHVPMMCSCVVLCWCGVDCLSTFNPRSSSFLFCFALSSASLSWIHFTAIPLPFSLSLPSHLLSILLFPLWSLFSFLFFVRLNGYSYLIVDWFLPLIQSPVWLPVFDVWKKERWIKSSEQVRFHRFSKMCITP